MKNKLVYIIGASMLTGSLVFGTVIGIQGSSVVVGGMGRSGADTYIVDASEANITEGLGVGSKKLSLGKLSVGDKVMIFGKDAKKA